MNTSSAQGVVVTSLLVTGTVATGSAIASHELPGIRLVIGLSVAGFGLAIGAQAAPELAAGLAALMATTAVFVYGGPLISALAHQTGSRKA